MKNQIPPDFLIVGGPFIEELEADWFCHRYYLENGLISKVRGYYYVYAPEINKDAMVIC